MNPVAKALVVAGVVLIIVGLLWQFSAGRGIPLGRLPGDIVVEKPGFRFYFPVVTSILASVILSLIFFVIRYFSDKR